MPDSLTETVECPCCGSGEFVCIEPARYPENTSRDELNAIYRSSSDHQLLDQLSECKSCGLVYLNPRVCSSIILAGYEAAEDLTFFSQNALRIRTFSRYIKMIDGRLRLLERGKRDLLDVGCAGGAFVKAAADLGFRPTGIEPSRWLVARAREAYGLDIRAGVLESFTFPEKAFDVITLWDVIEHLTDPRRVIVNAHALLRDEGVIVINYPDYASLAHRLLGPKWPFLLSVHLTYFTRKTITEFLDRCGFRVQLIKPFFQTLELGYVLDRATAYFGFFSILKALVGILRMDKLPVTYNIGQTLLIASKK